MPQREYTAKMPTVKWDRIPAILPHIRFCSKITLHPTNKAVMAGTLYCGNNEIEYYY
jgi:hypothetical protein